MIILPSRGRPERLENGFLSAYKETGATEPVYLVLDDDDAAKYSAFPLPENWKKLVYPRALCIEQVNRAFREFPGEDYYAVMTDDVVPETPGWDQKLKAACLPHYVSWGYDCYWGYQVAGLPFIGGDLARFLGWVICPKFKHYFSDCITAEIAWSADLDRYLHEVVTRHVGHTVHEGTPAPMDDTYRSHMRHFDADQGAYWEFRKDGLPQLLERVQSRFGSAH